MERNTAFVPGDLVILRWLAAILMFATMAVAFVDVVGRYLFNAPVFGATEIIQLLLGASIFAGLALVAEDDGHIAVDLFDPMFNRIFGRPRRILVGLVSAAGLALIGVELGRMGIDAVQTSRTTIVLQIPVAWMTLPGAVLCLCAALLQISHTVRRT